MAYYDSLAEGYNELHGEEQIKKAKIILKYIELVSSDYLLDVGCGTGIATELFNCKKTGIDPAKELLKHAKFPTQCAKAESLPFKDKTFDIIISLTAIHNFGNAEKAIKEMLRTGKDRCKYAITVLKKSAKAKRIGELLEQYFKVQKKIDEEKDTVYILKKKILQEDKN